MHLVELNLNYGGSYVPHILWRHNLYFYFQMLILLFAIDFYYSRVKLKLLCFLYNLLTLFCVFPKNKDFRS